MFPKQISVTPVYRHKEDAGVSDTGWRLLPTFNVENWLYIEGGRKTAYLVRISLKNGKGYMVRNGCRERIKYGKWFPVGPVPCVGEIVTGFDPEDFTELERRVVACLTYAKMWEGQPLHAAQWKSRAAEAERAIERYDAEQAKLGAWPGRPLK